MKYISLSQATEMNKLNPPAELILDGNLSERWTTWKKEFQFYLTVSPKTDQTKLNIQITIGNWSKVKGNLLYLLLYR